MTECSICCERSDNAKLPCFVCTGNDKAYCESCFASIAACNMTTFNMNIRCPYCRTLIEIHFQQNNTILIIQKGIAWCSLSNTSKLNKYIRKGYHVFGDIHRPSNSELEEIISTMIPCEQQRERYLFLNFLIKSSSKKQQSSTLEVPLMPVNEAYITWNRFRSVLEMLSNTKEEK